MGIVREIVHPEYDTTLVNNDFTLLVLERESIHPYVKINDDANIPVAEEELVVVGWGDIDPSENGQVISDELRETEVTYITNGQCEKSSGFVNTQDGLSWGSYAGGITGSMMCARDGVGTVSDACQGDSGELFGFLL